MHKIDIDWKVVDKLLQAECKGTEVAAYLGCHEDTLYNRCQDEKGMVFTAYSARMRSKGDSILRAKQHETALSGNVTMQIWLGKNRLGQKETHDVNIAPNDPQINTLLADVKAMKETLMKTQDNAPQP